jgi:23S rRNA (cytidine2498-2'-O)-methyltransferase
VKQAPSAGGEGPANVILTTHAEFLHSAVQELQRSEQQLRLVATLAPGIALCRVPDAAHFMHTSAQLRPIFTRHLAPVQAVRSLTQTTADLQHLAITLAELPTFPMLERGQRFSVQTRIAHDEQGGGTRPYSGGQLNQLLAAAIAEETGALEERQHPQIVVSLLCTQNRAYMGISPVNDNLSSWPGGMRHFAQTPAQISRAEFKLLEALEVFEVTLPEQGRALDLGAAPGGWSRLLLSAGLQVIAVDPACLDTRLAHHPGLVHVRSLAERYLGETGGARAPAFDVITSDMRMDARAAARLLVQLGTRLRPDGFVLSTLKLPHATASIDPLRNLREALNLLSRAFAIVQARQLFHNRQEVTVIAARPSAQGATRPSA